MTMCFKEVGAVSSSRSILDSLVVAIDKVGTEHRSLRCATRGPSRDWQEVDFDCDFFS